MKNKKINHLKLSPKKNEVQSYPTLETLEVPKLKINKAELNLPKIAKEELKKIKKLPDILSGGFFMLYQDVENFIEEASNIYAEIEDDFDDEKSFVKYVLLYELFRAYLNIDEYFAEEIIPTADYLATRMQMLLSRASVEEQLRILKYIFRSINKQTFVDNLVINTIFFRNFKEIGSFETLELKHAILDKSLVFLRNLYDQQPESYRPLLESILTSKLTLMSLNNDISLETIEKFPGKYLYSPGLLIFYVSFHDHYQRFDRAYAFLQDYLENTQEKSYLPIELKLLLSAYEDFLSYNIYYDNYEFFNKAFREGLNLATNRMDFENILIMLNAYQDKEFIEKLAKEVAEDTTLESYKRLAFLIDLELNEKALEFLRNNLNETILLDYGPELGIFYPEEIKEMFLSVFKDQPEKLKTRKEYKELLNRLDTYLDHGGDMEVIEGVLSYWEDKYKRRRALLDEIDKFRIHSELRKNLF